jgi:hypothetical protein
MPPPVQAAVQWSGLCSDDMARRREFESLTLWSVATRSFCMACSPVQESTVIARVFLITICKDCTRNHLLQVVFCSLC